MSKLSAAQKVENAMRRVEETSAELMQAAFNFGTTSRGSWSDTQQAQAVQHCARKYAAAMRRLQTAARS